ncbi:uncharacterized protein A4U43_C07F7060 [Asparagus officinalis]|uniref:PLAC8 family protein n=1 Tax=Asparagus officinalis TaxID=4686 RepID=A0A5P1EDB3_ASPOF|nr:uncharacterized protein LOC109846550 [Asparagus officinalis]ONK62701.1 uncharacterized protein A4U43_C07F7060 [Asparagus officinalis]
MMVSDCNDVVVETLVEIELNVDSSSSKSQRDCNAKLLDSYKASISRAFSIFRKRADEREETSALVPSRISITQHFQSRFDVVSLFKEWIKHPMNIALLVWFLCVAIAAIMLALLFLGLLDKPLPTKTSRNRWIEIDNQILNALFTLMSLYQHPNLFHHLVLLCRWRSRDIVELRKIYCKDGAHRNHERAHMLLVVLLLHIACFSQYVICVLYWEYPSTIRPEFIENLCIALGTISPVIAGLYTIYSPLGKECSSDTEEEMHGVNISNNARTVVNPEWNGGLFDCSEDKSTGILSFFCTFCVFGWNMERLGFGNMYVHMVTFYLLCFAPLWIFSISAMKISNEVIRDVVGLSGIVLGVFGMMYGGFWRIRMREKFGLPGNGLCCGSDSMADYVQWVFCWACSLAQEVRTVNFYEVEDDREREDAQLIGEGEVDSSAITTPPTRNYMRSESTGTYGNMVTSPPFLETEIDVSDLNQPAETKKSVELV